MHGASNIAFASAIDYGCSIAKPELRAARLCSQLLVEAAAVADAPGYHDRRRKVDEAFTPGGALLRDLDAIGAGLRVLVRVQSGNAQRIALQGANGAVDLGQHQRV